MVSSSESENPLSKFNPFAMKKPVECISTENSSISQLKYGNLLIPPRVAGKFIKLETKQILAKSHVNLMIISNLLKVLYSPHA